MAEPVNDLPSDTTCCVHMNALRREMRATYEQSARTIELLGRLNARLDTLTARFDQVQSDLILMENRDISRHGEILSILERLDRADTKPNPIDYGIASTGVGSARFGDPFRKDPKEPR